GRTRRNGGPTDQASSREWAGRLALLGYVGRRASTYVSYRTYVLGVKNFCVRAGAVQAPQQKRDIGAIEQVFHVPHGGLAAVEARDGPATPMAAGLRAANAHRTRKNLLFKEKQHNACATRRPSGGRGCGGRWRGVSGAGSAGGGSRWRSGPLRRGGWR